jgi:hypothetical protein
MRFLINHGHESLDSIPETGCGCREPLGTLCICQVRSPGSPLLVKVLFPDACAPVSGFLIVGGMDFEGAVP